MPEEDEITDNVLRLVEDLAPNLPDEVDLDKLLIKDLGFTKQGLLDLAFTINKDEYFKPLGVGLIPDDVTDCESVGELIALVLNEFNNDMPERRKKKK